MVITITINNIGSAVGSTFDIYSDLDGFVIPIVTNVFRDDIIAGYDLIVDNATTQIKIISIDCGTICTSDILNIPPPAYMELQYNGSVYDSLGVVCFVDEFESVLYTSNAPDIIPGMTIYTDSSLTTAFTNLTDVYIKVKYTINGIIYIRTLYINDNGIIISIPDCQYLPIFYNGSSYQNFIDVCPVNTFGHPLYFDMDDLVDGKPIVGMFVYNNQYLTDPFTNLIKVYIKVRYVYDGNTYTYTLHLNEDGSINAMPECGDLSIWYDGITYTDIDNACATDEFDTPLHIDLNDLINGQLVAGQQFYTDALLSNPFTNLTNVYIKTRYSYNSETYTDIVYLNQNGSIKALPDCPIPIDVVDVGSMVNNWGVNGKGPAADPTMTPDELKCDWDDWAPPFAGAKIYQLNGENLAIGTYLRYSNGKIWQYLTGNYVLLLEISEVMLRFFVATLDEGEIIELYDMANDLTCPPTPTPTPAPTPVYSMMWDKTTGYFDDAASACSSTTPTAANIYVAQADYIANGYSWIGLKVYAESTLTYDLRYSSNYTGTPSQYVLVMWNYMKFVIQVDGNAYITSMVNC